MSEYRNRAGRSAALYNTVFACFDRKQITRNPFSEIHNYWFYGTGKYWRKYNRKFADSFYGIDPSGNHSASDQLFRQFPYKYLFNPFFYRLKE